MPRRPEARPAGLDGTGVTGTHVASSGTRAAVRPASAAAGGLAALVVNSPVGSMRTIKLRPAASARVPKTGAGADYDVEEFRCVSVKTLQRRCDSARSLVSLETMHPDSVAPPFQTPAAHAQGKASKPPRYSLERCAASAREPPPSPARDAPRTPPLFRVTVAPPQPRANAATAAEELVLARRPSTSSSVLARRPSTSSASTAAAAESEPFVPCCEPRCPREATLWSPLERRPYCVVCWNAGMHHTATAVAGAGENDTTGEGAASHASARAAPPRVAPRPPSPVAAPPRVAIRPPSPVGFATRPSSATEFWGADAPSSPVTVVGMDGWRPGGDFSRPGTADDFASGGAVDFAPQGDDDDYARPRNGSRGRAATAAAPAARTVRLFTGRTYLADGSFSSFVDAQQAAQARFLRPRAQTSSAPQLRNRRDADALRPSTAAAALGARPGAVLRGAARGLRPAPRSVPRPASRAATAAAAPVRLLAGHGVEGAFRPGEFTRAARGYTKELRVPADAHGAARAPGAVQTVASIRGLAVVVNPEFKPHFEEDSDARRGTL
ncbi:hypothetical protein M885DRAFT_506745 [Pelagophyceae sp. CCMP2097]|nr:hypothetical protein M885DRAFT_506745 [Pelagophyceae sp. CCMP2097]